MAAPPSGLQHLSRRHLLKSIGLSPFFFRVAPLSGSGFAPPDHAHAAPQLADGRYRPSYPAKSPLEEVLRRVRPGSDEFVTEGYAYEIGLLLDRWAAAFKQQHLAALAATLHPLLETDVFAPSREVSARPETGRITTTRRERAGGTTRQPSKTVLQDLERWLPAHLQLRDADFEITSIEVTAQEPLSVRTLVRFSLVGSAAPHDMEHRTGVWHMDWVLTSASTTARAWQLRQWTAVSEERNLLRGPGFQDVTEKALGGTPSYSRQLLLGSDEWRTQLDGASGIDVYGNNGVAAGDYDGDGFDDLYVCQAAGLPNRLYRNRGDGTFEDVTDKAGVGVLDNTACALFADFRNVGLQDLLVVCGSGPLLFLNGGDGTFSLKQDAFHFARPAEGTFTHAAIADYDRDGRLDIYFCVYSYYLGLDQYHYPAPYYDARNGPPNFLFRNEGNATFTDQTAASGLNVENDRYSFACAWNESKTSGGPDLYVVNDFGRNNLYRNRGNGTFEAVSTRAHAEDVGAGMSAAWGDIDNDGQADLYVANMWSAAGQRVAQQPQFHASSPQAIRELYRTHASGNALYRNGGDGTFTNVSKAAGVQAGRWAWGSDFFDFDHDGYQDLYVTNGYITAPIGDAASGRGTPREEHDGEAGSVDLGSFFWRQVVGKSSDDASPSLAYEHGWNALNELIRTDNSWSGKERNVLFANNRDGTFSDVSGVAGLDFLEDSRSFALADLTHSGRLDVILKNRSAPQLRILRNSLENIGDSIIVRLRGTTSNRDAIGTVVTLDGGTVKQTRSLEAGSGFLAQHSKELLFGLGNGTGPLRATVRWPSGVTQQFDGLPRNHRVTLVEGSAQVSVAAFVARAPAAAPVGASKDAATTTPQDGTWLLDPLEAPGFQLKDLQGSTQRLESTRGQATLLVFWSIDAPACAEQLLQLQGSRRVLANAGVALLTLTVDTADSLDRAQKYVAQHKLELPVLMATDDIAGTYNIIYRYLFDRRRNLPLPAAFLLDANGMLVKVYQGPVRGEQVVRDARSIPATPQQRMAKALPFPGKLYTASFVRNDFTYGIAMFQHGYLDQAAKSFEQVVATRPDDAEAFYNLGTLDLRRNRLDDAQRYLRRTLDLKPNYPEAWNNLGMIAAQQGRMEEAVQSFRQSLSLRPAYGTALLNLGNAYRRQRAYGDAADCLTRALALQPDDPEINYSLGMLSAQQGQLAQANTYLQKAINLRPEYPEALNNLGVLAVRQNNYADAEAQFQTCIRLVPSFQESYINLARLYVLQNARDKARDILQALLKVNPESAAARQGLAALDAAH